jgi:hypothetical protein
MFSIPCSLFSLLFYLLISNFSFGFKVETPSDGCGGDFSTIQWLSVIFFDSSSGNSNSFPHFSLLDDRREEETTEEVSRGDRPSVLVLY